MTDRSTTRPDEGMQKGAVEDDTPYPGSQANPQNTSLSGQLGHRDQDEMLKDARHRLPRAGRRRRTHRRGKTNASSFPLVTLPSPCFCLLLLLLFSCHPSPKAEDLLLSLLLLFVVPVP